MAKKQFSICTLESGKWKQWGAGETNIQNRSELVKHVQKMAKKDGRKQKACSLI